MVTKLGRAVVDNGILTDEHLATSALGIFAAGDVARAWHPRLEHWSSALHQGPAAAKNMLGIVTADDRVPFFFSDQYDVRMEYSGFATNWDQVIFRVNRRVASSSSFGSSRGLCRPA